MRPTAAPLIVHMRICLGGVAIVCDYPHPAVEQKLSMTFCITNQCNTLIVYVELNMVKISMFDDQCDNGLINMLSLRSECTSID